MNRVLILVIFIVFLQAGDCFARDPFSPFISKDGPSSGETTTETSTSYSVPEDVEPLAVVIEGIVSGDNFSHVVIDGEVYEEGEIIKGINARILKISNENASILYGGVVYHEKVSK